MAWSKRKAIIRNKRRNAELVDRTKAHKDWDRQWDKAMREIYRITGDFEVGVE